MTELRDAVLRTGGRRLRYLVGGAGPPLLLCHGFMGSAENFGAWTGALSTRRTLVIPDLPGCGASDPLAVEHSCDALADALDPLLAALGVARFDLAGLCLGVPVAAAVARRRPWAVGRLLLHTPLLSPVLVRASFHLQVRAMTAPMLFPAVRRASRSRLLSDLYKRLLVEGSDVDGQTAEINFRNQVRADDRSLREWLRDGLRRDDTALVIERRAPTLLMVAARDRIVDVARLRALAARCPDAQLAVDEDAGHGWTQAGTARQLAVMCDFLDGADCAAGVA